MYGKPVTKHVRLAIKLGFAFYFEKLPVPVLIILLTLIIIIKFRGTGGECRRVLFIVVSMIPLRTREDTLKKV